MVCLKKVKKNPAVAAVGKTEKKHYLVEAKREILKRSIPTIFFLLKVPLVVEPQVLEPGRQGEDDVCLVEYASLHQPNLLQVLGQGQVAHEEVDAVAGRGEKAESF